MPMPIFGPSEILMCVSSEVEIDLRPMRWFRRVVRVLLNIEL